MSYYSSYNSWYHSSRNTWVVDELPYEAKKFLLNKVFNFPDSRWYKYTAELGCLYGAGVEEYANETRWDWRSGITRPSGKTINRIVKIAPKFLSQEDKNHLVSLIAQKYLVSPTKGDGYYIFQADKPLAPQLEEAKKEINDFVKPRQAQMPALPDNFFGSLTWLYENDAKAIQAVLALMDAEKANAVDAITLQSVPSALTKIVEFYNSETVGNIQTKLKFDQGTYSLSISRDPPPGFFDNILNCLGPLGILLFIPFLPLIMIFVFISEIVKGIFKNE